MKSVRNPSSSAGGNFQILKWSLVDESSPLGSATMLEDKVVRAVRLKLKENGPDKYSSHDTTYPLDRRNRRWP